MVEIMILTASDGFVVYDLRTNERTHYNTFNWSSLDTKVVTTKEAVEEFESWMEKLK